MNTHRFSIGIITALLAASLATSARADFGPSASSWPGAPVAQAGTAFSYQGQMRSGGAPVNGTCDIAFRLYDAAVGGTQLGGALTPTLAITNGLFTTGLDFGAGAFSGDARWLDLQARCPAGSGAFVGLAPRQAITAVPYAINADLLDGQHASAFVTRAGAQVLSGTITFSSGVRFADGTLQTSAFRRPGLPGAGVATNLEGEGDGLGRFSAIAIGADGLGLIAFYRPADGLKVLHCGNAACNSGNIATVVDNAGDVGYLPSVAIGVDGRGLISYADGTNGDLKVLHCGNLACSISNTITTVDSVDDVGYYSSIAIGADGLGLISYHDTIHLDLKVLHCGDAACTSGNVSATVDSAGDVGYFASITIGADGLGLISYRDATSGHPKVLHCGNALCGSGNVSTTFDFSGAVGYFTSITIGADGLGLMSYFEAGGKDRLKVMHCGNVTCDSGNTTTVADSEGVVGDYSSIIIGTDGLGLISYRDATHQALKVLHCGDALCSSGNLSATVDAGGGLGFDTSIAIGPDGLGLISYRNNPSGDLRVFHCGNPNCSSTTRVGR